MRRRCGPGQGSRRPRRHHLHSRCLRTERRRPLRGSPRSDRRSGLIDWTLGVNARRTPAGLRPSCTMPAAVWAARTGCSSGHSPLCTTSPSAPTAPPSRSLSGRPPRTRPARPPRPRRRSLSPGPRRAARAVPLGRYQATGAARRATGAAGSSRCMSDDRVPARDQSARRPPCRPASAGGSSARSRAPRTLSRGARLARSGSGPGSRRGPRRVRARSAERRR
jgi:hypothetical protein